MRAIIVDDEAKSRRFLKALCSEYCKDIEIVGLAASVSEARILLKELSPDIVFLDIRMPVENGFMLLEDRVDADEYQVIFTTAYDEYVLKAFKYSAIDYLLKPIEIEELVGAVERCVEKVQIKNQHKRLNHLKKNLYHNDTETIALATLEGYTFVRCDEIIRCEAKGNYTQLFFKDNSSLLLTKTLKYFDDLLSERGFFRVHRSNLINLKFVRKFLKGKQCAIEMVDGQQVEVSIRRKEALLKELSL